MRIGLLSYNLGQGRSGQSRFLLNIANGLKALNHTPVIFSIFINQQLNEILEKATFEHYSYSSAPGLLMDYWTISYNQSFSKKLKLSIEKAPLCDFYVVLADEAIPVVNFLKGKKVIYISQGDWNLLFLTKKFSGVSSLASTILSRRFVGQVKRNSQIVDNFDLILANSKFTKGLMSFLYDSPIKGVVYPPVNHMLFHGENSTINSKNPYALVMVRNSGDPVYQLASRIAKKVDTVVFGGGEVKGARNLGFVDDDQLAQLYSNASITISPNNMEFYGYSLVESISSGTPVVAFNSGGAPEIITNGFNGWLVDSVEDFIEIVVNVIKEGYSSKVRDNCVSSSRKFGIETSTNELLRFISNL